MRVMRTAQYRHTKLPVSTSFLTSAGAIAVTTALLSIALWLFAAILCEALLEARKEMLNFLQEKEQQTVYVRRQADERGQ